MFLLQPFSTIINTNMKRKPSGLISNCTYHLGGTSSTTKQVDSHARTPNARAIRSHTGIVVPCYASPTALLAPFGRGGPGIGERSLRLRDCPSCLWVPSRSATSRTNLLGDHKTLEFGAGHVCTSSPPSYACCDTHTGCSGQSLHRFARQFASRWKVGAIDR